MAFDHPFKYYLFPTQATSVVNYEYPESFHLWRMQCWRFLHSAYQCMFLILTDQTYNMLHQIIWVLSLH